ncbi:MAG: ATP-grasp domain-containing protein [Patescibacteria group bacterium]
MIRVGVIRGGPSSEYEVSLNTGANVLSHLRGDVLREKYKPVDILIDKDATWHVNGKPITLEHVSNNVDVIFNALHGEFGEDGKVQQMLNQWKIPYTGSGAFASALGYNKAMAKDRFKNLGIKTPESVIITKDSYDVSDKSPEDLAKEQARYVWSKIPPSWVVKPISSGSSVGVKVCKTFPELEDALLSCIIDGVDILVEEMIEGKEATVGVVEGFRGQKTYTLPPIEIRVPKHKTFFDYDAKYSGISEEICPGNFTNDEKEELARLASLIHTGLNLDHYSRSDFIVHPRRGIYALEVNTLPGLTDASLTPKALYAVGATMPEFISHLLTLALNKNNPTQY